MNQTSGSSSEITKIRQALHLLKDALERPLAAKILELGENLETSRARDDLTRLLRSLDQYAQRERDLYYVGFVGHFSSGKSSTINSLFSLAGTDNARQVGNNPTDTCVTLLTSRANQEALLPMTRESDVSIRVDYVEHALLSALVVADTPGSGDPLLVEAIVNDFLPVCDLILYFVSAAVPVDSADIPLLKQQIERLPFIPLRFVVTRADEFKLDPERPLQEENFDRPAATSFLEALAQRLQAILGSGARTPGEFFFIDNKSGFAIDQVRRYIESMASRSAPADIVEMHEHKVDYYRAASSAIKELLESFVRKKLDSLSKFVGTTRQNIDRYDGKVQISNNRMTDKWSRIRGELRTSHSEAVERIKTAANEEEVPHSIAEFDAIRTLVAELKSTASTWAGYNSTEAASKLRALIAEEAERRKEDALLRLAQDAIDLDRPIEIGSAWDFDWDERDRVHAVPSVLHFQAGKLMSESAEALESSHAAIVGEVAALHNRLIQKYPLTGYVERIAEVRTALDGDIDTFFEVVNVYRAGVFSLQTRDYIATLRIEEDLTSKEQEFSEEEQEEIRARARTEMFPQLDDERPHIEGGYTDLRVRAGEVVSEARSIDVTPVGDVNAGGLASNMDGEALTDNVLASGEQLLKSKLDRTTEEMASSLRDSIGAHQGRRAEYYRARRRRLAKFSLGGLVLALVLSTAYLLWKVPSAGTIGEAVVIGLLVTITPAILLRFRDKTESRVLESRDRLLEDTRERLGAVVAKAKEDDAAFTVQVQQLRARLERRWHSYVDRVVAAIEANGASDTIRRLRSSRARLLDLRRKYLALVNGIQATCDAGFSDEDRNLTTMRAIAEEIKTRAIDPSFELLQQTEADLQAVVTEIEQADP